MINDLMFNVNVTLRFHNYTRARVPFTFRIVHHVHAHTTKLYSSFFVLLCLLLILMYSSSNHILYSITEQPPRNLIHGLYVFFTNFLLFNYKYIYLRDKISSINEYSYTEVEFIKIVISSYS